METIDTKHCAYDIKKGININPINNIDNIISKTILIFYMKNFKPSLKRLGKPGVGQPGRESNPQILSLEADALPTALPRPV